MSLVNCWKETIAFIYKLCTLIVQTIWINTCNIEYKMQTKQAFFLWTYDSNNLLKYTIQWFKRWCYTSIHALLFKKFVCSKLHTIAFRLLIKWTKIRWTKKMNYGIHSTPIFHMLIILTDFALACGWLILWNHTNFIHCG